MGAASVGAQALQFLVSIVMARLLLPSQFGEAALAYSITAFAMIFTDLGLSAAIVHAPRVTEELLSSAFWLSALTGLGLTIATCVLAFPVAAIYGKPELLGLLIVASLNFTFSCGGVHLALLERSLNFRRIAFIETVCALIGSLVAPLLALLGFGVYSLMIGPLFWTCLSTALFWANVRWWPRRWASRREIRDLWMFSRGLVGFNVINYWSRNLDNLLLGGTVSSGELGQYSRSYNLMMIPVGQMGGVMMRVLFPALSRMQDEPKRMARAWSRALAAVSGSFAMPLALTMAATAPAMVKVLYGQKWMGMVPVLEVLSIAAVPQIVGAATGGAYRAAGRTGLLFKVGVASTTLAIVAIIAGLPWGIMGVAITFMLSCWIIVPISVGPLARILGVPLSNLLLPIIAGWGPAAAAAGGELIVRLSMPSGATALEVLTLQLAVGGAIYLTAMWRSNSEIAVAARARVRRLLAIRLRATSNPTQ